MCTDWLKTLMKVLENSKIHVAMYSVWLVFPQLFVFSQTSTHECYHNFMETQKVCLGYFVSFPLRFWIKASFVAYYSTHTVFSWLYTPGFYFKLGLLDPAFIWSRHLIKAWCLLTRWFFFLPFHWVHLLSSNLPGPSKVSHNPKSCREKNVLRCH